MFIKQGVHCWMGCFKKKRGWHELRVVHPFLQGPLHHWSEPCLLPRTYTCNLWKCSLVLHRSVGTTHMVTTRASNYLTRSLSPTEQSAAFSTGRGNQLACLCKCKQSTGLISGARVWLAPPPHNPGHRIPVASLNRLLCHVLLSAAACRHPCTGTDKRQSGALAAVTHTQTHILQGALLALLRPFVFVLSCDSSRTRVCVLPSFARIPFSIPSIHGHLYLMEMCPYTESNWPRFAWAFSRSPARKWSRSMPWVSSLWEFVFRVLV